MNLNNIGRNTNRTNKGWYLAKEHDGAIDGAVTGILISNKPNIVNTTLNALPIPRFVNGRIDDVSTMYIEEENGSQKELEGLIEAEITIPSDSWLQYQTSSYSVSFKGVSDTKGVGQNGHMLQRRPQVEKNGKMSW